MINLWIFDETCLNSAQPDITVIMSGAEGCSSTRIALSKKYGSETCNPVKVSAYMPCVNVIEGYF